jgi:hypothetical protein
LHLYEILSEFNFYVRVRTYEKRVTGMQPLIKVTMRPDAPYCIFLFFLTPEMILLVKRRLLPLSVVNIGLVILMTFADIYSWFKLGIQARIVQSFKDERYKTCLLIE